MLIGRQYIRMVKYSAFWECDGGDYLSDRQQ
jgi:hypothetical protein